MVAEPIPVDDPFGDPPTQEGGGGTVTRLIDWQEVFNGGEHYLLAAAGDIADFLGLSQGQQSQLLGVFADDVIKFEHFTNIKLAYYNNLFIYILDQMSRTGWWIEHLSVELVQQMLNLTELVAGLVFGPPGQGTSPTLTPDDVIGLIQQQIVPLTENLGQINSRLDVIDNRLRLLEQNQDAHSLTDRVSRIESHLSTQVDPSLLTISALLNTNVLPRLDQEEECCAANSGFKNDWQDLLNKLKPLFDLLKLLNIAALLELLEHIWSEGLPGFVREIEGIIKSTVGEVEGDLSGFLGI